MSLPYSWRLLKDSEVSTTYDAFKGMKFYTLERWDVCETDPGLHRPIEESRHAAGVPRQRFVAGSKNMQMFWAYSAILSVAGH